MQQQVLIRDPAVLWREDADRDGPALVIDLEGALLGSHLVQEAFFADAAGCLARGFDALLNRQGVFFKRSLAEAKIDYAHLPYDADILNIALAARAQGRKIYISTRGYPHHAAAIASHLGFDGVVASDELVTAGRGAGHPDYIGHGQAPKKDLRHVSWRTWLQALRVYQYAKNTLVFVPALTSHQINLTALGQVLLAFLAFSACASGGYLLNDLLDLTADRHHPNKRYRPAASGALPISAALIAIPVLWAAALGAGLFISGMFVAILGAYLAITVAYSLYLKKKMLVDIVTLAGLYIIRIVGGAVAIGVYISEWLMIFALFIFTSLALIKRYSELAMREEAGLSSPANRDYRISDRQILAAMAAAAGMNAITVFSLYLSSPTVTQMYERPWMLWLLNPLLLYWIGRALMLAHRRAMPDDPIVYTFKDNASRTAVLAMMCVVLAAI